MATVERIQYGSRTSFAKVANLNSLPAGEAKVIGVINNATDRFPCREIDIAIMPGASAGRFEVFCAKSGDGGTSYVDGIDPDSDLDQASKILNADPVRTIWNASSTLARQVFRLPYDVHPERCVLLVKNSTAAATGSTGAVAGHKPVNSSIETV